MGTDSMNWQINREPVRPWLNKNDFLFFWTKWSLLVSYGVALDNSGWQPIDQCHSDDKSHIRLCFHKQHNEDAVMAYFHCRTRIPILCRFFHWFGFRLRSLIEKYVMGTEIICPWDRNLSLKWVHYLFGHGIWILASGNMFCIILCSQRVWNLSQYTYEG